MGAYEEQHRRSLTEREAFWSEAARDVHWDAPFARVLDASAAPLYR